MRFCRVSGTNPSLCFSVNNLSCRACSKSNGFVQRAASESSYSRTIRPLHLTNEPFSQLQNNMNSGAYQRQLHSSTSALAVVPFRESRLPSSSVSYSVDGRLTNDTSDVMSSYSTHISKQRRAGSVTTNSHGSSYGLRRYVRSRSADEVEARDNISIRAFSDIGPSRVANPSYTPYHITGERYNHPRDIATTREGHWSSASDATRPERFRAENDYGDS